MISKIASSLVALALLTAAANADVGVVEATGQFQFAGGTPPGSTSQVNGTTTSIGTFTVIPAERCT